MLTPRLYLPFVVFAFALVLWQGVTHAFDVPNYLFPGPLEVRDAFLEQDGIGHDFLVTATESVLGFAVGTTAGIFIGIMIVQLPLIEWSLMPYVVALKTVPIVALAPLLVVWFGYGLATKVLLSALICFFPAVIATIQGLRDVSRTFKDIFRMCSASRFQEFNLLLWPNALTHIFSALRISVVLSVIGAIVAEFAGATSGLGFRILVASYQVDTPLMFVYIFLSSLLGLVLYGGVVLFEGIVVPWSHSRRN